jgi:hypothetical protein
MLSRFSIRTLYWAALINLLIFGGTLATWAGEADTPDADGYLPGGPAKTTQTGEPEGTLSPDLNGNPVRKVVGLVRVPLTGTIDNFGVRFASSDDGFAGLDQEAMFVGFRLPAEWLVSKRLVAQPRLTLEAGRIIRGSDSHAFASFGPSLRFSSAMHPTPWFVDIGISPTVIDGATYEGEDFGTSFNFTSHIALGLRFGQASRQEVRLRYQHISNGGINNTNPGVNMVGIDFTVRVP